MIYGMILLMILGAAALVGISSYYVAQHRREKERKQCYEAAERLIQEEYLNYSIHNYRNHPVAPPARKKIMLYLREETNKKNGYVFDPLHIIRIGRSRDENDICIQEASVSGNHCRIYQDKTQIVLQDFGSSNGTLVKRGCKKRWLCGKAIYLQDGDKVCVGKTCFKISMFCYDQKYM
ncbi:MAG: FHA domain-containing protein [Lachnospiraceae bacterium]|nr:FHA domain-containing protein [Lachnospiraceae bacterium]